MQIELILTNNNISDIYEKLPKFIKKHQKNDSVNLICNEKIKDEQRKKEIEEVIHAINIKDKRKRYQYIYDIICEKLDNDKCYCEFKNNICEKYRNKNKNHLNGCCETRKGEKCQYLSKNGCTEKCISCKFFTCDYLKKKDKSIKKGPNDFILSKYFFNLEQKSILLFTFFTTEDEIIDKLLAAKFKK